MTRHIQVLLSILVMIAASSAVPRLQGAVDEAIMTFDSLTVADDQFHFVHPNCTPTSYSEAGYTLDNGVGCGLGFYGTLSPAFPGSTALLNVSLSHPLVL